MANRAILTPHSRMNAGAWVQTGSIPRTFDHTIGWSDGSAQTILKLVPIGFPNTVLDYNWRLR